MGEMRSSRPRVLAAVLVVGIGIVLVPATASVAGEGDESLEVVEVHWGFNGQVVVNAFNPVAIVLHNLSQDELTGTLELRRLRGAYWPVDLPIQQPLFLSPDARRPYRFYPYIVGDFDDWQLTFITTDGKRRVLNPSAWRPRVGHAAVIRLDPPDLLRSRGGRLRSMREHLFPPASTATNGLAGVVLDHVPRWESVRRRAFVQWLSAGGTLHLLLDSDGKPVRFSGELAVLNGIEATQRLGNGRIVRHAIRADAVDKKFMDLVEPPPPKPELSNRLDEYGAFDSLGSLGLVEDAGLFSTLRSMTRPLRNWPLIYLACGVYVMWLFPGCYAFAQNRHRDYRMVLGVLVGTVVVFSILFFFIGRRDDAARMTIRSISIARSLPDGDLDLTQWVDAAVTLGGTYRFSHSGTSRLYSTAQDMEKVIGTIRQGTEASFSAEVPPYSSRTFLFRGRQAGAAVPLRVVDFDAGGGQLVTLSLLAGEGFPAKISEAAVLFGGHFYALVAVGKQLQLGQRLGSVDNMVYRGLSVRQGRLPPTFDPEFDEYREVEDAFAEMYGTLVLRSLGLNVRREVTSYRLPPGRLKVFVYARSPASFHVQADQASDQVGYVLYSWDLPTVDGR